VSDEVSEHAVIIHFNYNKQNLEPLHLLEDRLEEIVTANAVGTYDGHEIAINLSDGSLFLYGPNAEKLFKIVKPTLESCDFMIGAIAILRFGPPGNGVKEIELVISKAENLK
jgi:hypothetical protein